MYGVTGKDLTILPYSEDLISAGWFLSIVFLIRSIGDFNMLGIFKKIKQTEFSEFDTKYFIPLTLFWSFTFSLLAYQA